MKFLIDLATLTVTALPQGTSWLQIPGVTNNGQHYQLNGTVLAEYRPSEGELILLHPETGPAAGHYDIKYCPHRSDGHYGVSIQGSSHWVSEIDFASDSEVRRSWPDGGWHLLSTINSLEQELALKVAYTPRLGPYIAHSFRHTTANQP